MSDTLDTSAEGSRMLLQAINNCKPARPDPIKSAFETMMLKLADIKPPHIPVVPEPEQLEAIGAHALEVAEIMDGYFRALGQELQQNAPCKIDPTTYRNIVSGAVEGYLDFEARRAGDILRDDRAEAAA